MIFLGKLVASLYKTKSNTTQATIHQEHKYTITWNKHKKNLKCKNKIWLPVTNSGLEMKQAWPIFKEVDK